MPVVFLGLLYSLFSSLLVFALVSPEDIVLENSPCKINLAPEIPRVDTLPSCAFPADFILLLVCVEF